MQMKTAFSNRVYQHAAGHASMQQKTERHSKRKCRRCIQKKSNNKAKRNTKKYSDIKSQKNN